MELLDGRTRQFRERLQKLPREELLELIELQDPELRAQVNRIEWVFANKLTHLTWSDGSPIMGRELTNEELSLLVDEPFEVDPELTKLGLSIMEQRQIHVAHDPVLWVKEVLGAKPRAYQILIMRHPSLKKVLRAGRRLGKTVSMAFLILHYAFTTKNGRVLVLTPMKTQGALIYEEVMKHVKNSAAVQEAITRNVTSPQYEINLTNGSTIRFFSTGMKSGGRSDVTRGQEAHMIVLDELDYMGDDDLEAVFAMLQKTSDNQPDKKLIGASTPTGRRAVFWQWCVQQKDIFQEFWFPSYANPFWDGETEKFFRSQYTEMGYRHEIEADWGEDVDGVYPRKFIDMAFHGNDWSYLAERTDGETFHVMGVDWDKYGAGTNMVVLEVFPQSHPNRDMAGKYRVAYREETKKEEYALMKAVNRIIDLHRIFHFKHIYVDRGFGEVQVEMLHAYGIEHPTSKLHEIVKGVSFAETIEVRDPFRMQKVKKEVKPFMVDNLRQFLEQQKIKFPEKDEELYMQLISYVVLRTTSTGRPVFEAPGKIGDHAHDALILACLAITDNYNALLKPNYATESFVVSNHTFLPTVELSADPGKRKVQEEYFEDKYGSVHSAPVRIQRSGLGPRSKRGKGPIRRGMF
jgi:hypothetical protein